MRRKLLCAQRVTRQRRGAPPAHARRASTRQTAAQGAHGAYSRASPSRRVRKERCWAARQPARAAARSSGRIAARNTAVVGRLEWTGAGVKYSQRSARAWRGGALLTRLPCSSLNADLA
jgi:hypothetical protein